MNNSYEKVLKNVATLLDGYPTEEELFASTDKFVLFLLYSSKFQVHLYDYLVDKNDSVLAPYRMLVPTNLNGEKVTFVFYEFSKTKKTTAEKLADAIYVKKMILKQPIKAKILCKDKFYSCPVELRSLCSACLGLMECGIYPSHECFTEESIDQGMSDVDAPRLLSEFFNFLHEDLIFETIDPSNIIWEIQPETKKMIMGYFKDFNKDVGDFAGKVCDYITPDHSYESTNITKLNATYARFQVTNTFRFIKKEDINAGVIQPFDYLYVPDNLDDSFQRINISMAEIENDWRRIIATTRIIEDLKQLRQPRAVRQLMAGCRNNMNGIWMKEYLYLHIDERTQQLRNIHDQIEDYQNRVDYESDMFKQVVADKFGNISASLISSLVEMHVDSFSKSIRKLDTWIDANLLDLKKDTQVLMFFKNLNKKVDKYFSHSNAYIINSWFLFHRRHVPHDWQDRLAGFGRPTQYWLLPEYELEDTILGQNVTFSDYVNLVDYYLRESFEFLVDGFESYIRPTQNYFLVTIDRWKIESFANTQNFTQFFEGWRQIAGRQAKVVDLLQTKYEQKFANFSFETVQQTFRNSVRRAVLFMRDSLDFIENKPNTVVIYQEIRYHHPKVQAIFSQLKQKGQPLFQEFKQTTLNRLIQHVITLESSSLDSVLDRLGVVLIETLKSHNTEAGDWKQSQPFRRMVTLKYSLTSYEDFLQSTKLIFETSFSDVPGAEWAYLKSLQVKFEYLRKHAELVSIEGGINTRWNWGRGFRSDEKSVKISGVSSGSSATENTFLLMFFGVILLMRMIKSMLGL